MADTAQAQQISRIFEAAAALHQQTLAERREAIVQAARVIQAALAAGRRVLVCGNGGSAADAQHFAAELVGRFLRERAAWPALALTTDTSVLTAVANDYGFERVFARQVEGHGQAGDVLVAISTSGRSPNVVAAIAAARSRGMGTIGLTGCDGGDIARMVDVHLNVPSPVTARVQEVHITILHALCELLDGTAEQEPHA